MSSAQTGDRAASSLEDGARISIMGAMLSLTRGCSVVFLVAVMFVVGACKGDTGPTGPEGPPGEPGPPGPPAQPGLEPEPFGLVGRVFEPNMEPVPSGTVYLVPAADVEQLAETPIDIFLSPEATASSEVDEPIEDLLDTRGDDYAQAAVDAEGVYRFVALPEEEASLFVVWSPESDDDGYLPGGDSSQTSFSNESLLGMQMDIRVSAQPTPGATYVGSSTCMVCHGLHGTTRTAHNVGLQVPGVRSILQDIEPWPSFDDALAIFDGNATTLYYFNCDDAAPTAAKCSVDDQPPAGAVAFTVNLRRDASVPLGEVGAYYVEMVNGATERYDVVLTYGGALERQQYLMRRENPSGTYSYFVLPLQYNYQGDFSNPDPADWPWADYRSDLWYDLDGDTLREPANGDSFDNNCAGCHFTGYRLEGSEQDGWAASAAVDPEGAFDYDGDGRPELINTGCEACHGPGSQHLELTPRAGYIVSPGSLTPGRQAVMCGACHSRPLGIGAGMTGLPLSEEDEMPQPGTRRAEFALANTTRVGGAPDAFFPSGDPEAHYQQYSDHLRSRHYRNPVRLTTCTGCHNPHENAEDVAAMDTSDNPNVVCTTCHSPEVNPELYPVGAHVVEVTGFAGHASLPELFGPYLCTECHMVPTARAGAAVRALFDPIDGPPAVQYFWNDIASHRMTVTLWDESTGMPEQALAFTNVCGECHGEFLPNNPTP